LLENRNHRIAQGIFNTETDELLDGQKFEAKELAPELEEAHAKEDLVIYN
jgi:hypothetical protein